MRRSSHLLAGVLAVAVVAFWGREAAGDVAAAPSQDALAEELGTPARCAPVRRLKALHHVNEANATVLAQASGDVGGVPAVRGLTGLLAHRSAAVRRACPSAVVRVGLRSRGLVAPAPTFCTVTGAVRTVTLSTTVGARH